LIRRASAIEIELERMEGLLSAGGLVDLDVFTRSASHLRRQQPDRDSAATTPSSDHRRRRASGPTSQLTADACHALAGASR